MAIATQDVLLNCGYADKDEAKALGARWSGDKRSWFVPAGTELGPFSRWLSGKDRPAAASVSDPFGMKSAAAGTALGPALPSALGAPPDNAPQLSVAEFVGGARKAVLSVYDHDVWLLGQITPVKERRSMVVLELMDSGQEGAAGAAKIDVKAFSGAWDSLSARFLAQTGQAIAAGMTVRVKVRTEFDLKYHLGARLMDIDPTATVGAFEMRLREIRAKLKAEGVLSRNKDLPAPEDFLRVAVVHPHGASGFADFKADADKLEAAGLCSFLYLESTFEGVGAERSLLDALRRAEALHAQAPLDALAVIRGGGSKQGLMSLSVESLARAICLFPAPVITGLGHADDDTLLDEVSWRRCDTPSKTIAFVRDAIRGRAKEGKDAFERIRRIGQALLNEQGAQLERLSGLVSSEARMGVKAAERSAEEGRHAVLSAARDGRSRLAVSAGTLERAAAELRVGAPAALASAKAAAEGSANSLSRSATAALASAKGRLDRERNAVASAGQKTVSDAKRSIDRSFEEIRILARTRLDAVSTAAAQARALVDAMGPDATLRRGFALVLSPDGAVLSDAGKLRKAGRARVRLRDGEVSVLVEEEPEAPESGRAPPPPAKKGRKKAA